MKDVFEISFSMGKQNEYYDPALEFQASFRFLERFWFVEVTHRYIYKDWNTAHEKAKFFDFASVEQHQSIPQQFRASEPEAHQELWRIQIKHSLMS